MYITESHSRKPLVLWLVANLFFAFQFIMRLSVGLLREDIMLQFEVDAAAFSTVAGYYYLGYGLAQIPFGLMLDRLSYRVVTSMAILCTAVGMYIFTMTLSWNLLLFSRFLIGFGSGVSFLSVAKITKACFKPKYHSPLIGFSFTLGLIGAVCSTTPLIMVFEWFGYKEALLYMSYIAAIMAFITFISGKIAFPVQAMQTNIAIHRAILDVFCNYRLILIASAGGLLVGPLEGFADVWAGAFFAQILNFSVIDSANITMYIYFGMCCGGPILVFCSEKIGSELKTIILIAILMTLLFIYVFALKEASFIVMSGLMFLLGILCCYQVLVFNLASREAGYGSTGLAISSVNCINMSCGYIFHMIIGNLFDHYWSGKFSSAGVAIYDKIAFVSALSVIPMGCILGMIGFIILLRDAQRRG